MPLNFKKCLAIKKLTKETSGTINEFRQKLGETHVRSTKLIGLLIKWSTTTEFNAVDFAKNIITELYSLQASGVELGSRAFALHTIAQHEARAAEELQRVPFVVTEEFAGLDPHIAQAAIAELWAASDAAFDLHQTIAGAYRSNMESMIGHATVLVEEITFYKEHVSMVEAWSL